MNSHDKLHYKKNKSAFSTWMINNTKNRVRIADINDCRNAWNSAITAAIRVVNRSNMYNVIANLQKLKEKLQKIAVAALRRAWEKFSYLKKIREELSHRGQIKKSPENQKGDGGIGYHNNLN